MNPFRKKRWSFVVGIENREANRGCRGIVGHGQRRGCRHRRRAGADRQARHPGGFVAARVRHVVRSADGQALARGHRGDPVRRQQVGRGPVAPR